MNFADGRVITREEADSLLGSLEGRVGKTLSGQGLSSRTVVEACDKLAADLDGERYLALTRELGIPEALAREYIEQARTMFSAPYLEARLKVELDGLPGRTREYTPPFGEKRVRERVLPLGVLLHVPAGNAGGLPAFSVLEGLLTGNINILKLPQADNGLSVRLLEELVAIQPALAEYLYVFDYSSRDTASITALLDVADGVVLWGGDSAVAALRGLVRPNTRLIEWGHKISFAYATPSGITPGGLEAVARNMCATGQLLCSSCQGIYLDTASMAEVHRFCDRFLPYLERAHQEFPQPRDIGTQSHVTLQLYHQSLETAYRGSTLFWTDSCAVAAYPDERLETAAQFGNCWVRPLPRTRIVEALRPYKNHLQTCGLLASPAEARWLTTQLWNAGLIRVTDPADMAGTYCGAPHDGEYPLRRYIRTASTL